MRQGEHPRGGAEHGRRAASGVSQLLLGLRRATHTILSSTLHIQFSPWEENEPYYSLPLYSKVARYNGKTMHNTVAFIVDG